MFIFMGKMGTFPVDTSQWDAHCISTLGYKVPVGKKLKPEDWKKLGYHSTAVYLGTNRTPPFPGRMW